MTDTPPPPDHALQPPLAEGEWLSLELKWARMCSKGDIHLPIPTMTVRICRAFIEVFAQLEPTKSALAQMARERDAAVEAAQNWEIQHDLEEDHAKAWEARAKSLNELLNNPHNSDWLEGVRVEAPHQQLRYAPEHDANKNPWDWFWLIGYLSQKAAAADLAGEPEKAKHHTISTGAALLNWHRHIVARAAPAGTSEPEGGA